MSKKIAAKAGKAKATVKTAAAKARPVSRAQAPRLAKAAASAKASGKIIQKASAKPAAQSGTSRKIASPKKSVNAIAKKAGAGKVGQRATGVKAGLKAALSTVQVGKSSAVAGRALTGAPSNSVRAIIEPARTMAAAKVASPKKTEGPIKKMAARAKIADIVLPAGYRPSENEPFMSEMHRAYFRRRLLEWKDDIVRQTRETLAILHEDSAQHADLADRATSETDRATELRTRDRQRKLIAKIDAALTRIEDGSYGYCEDTGEPIGLKRLDARPIATLSVEAQERHERREKVYREE